MRAVRVLFLSMFLLGSMALACNFGQAPATPTPFATPEATSQSNATPLPTATAPAPAEPAPTDFITYSNDELGLNFGYPAGWALETSQEFITVVSNPELLTVERFDTGAGVLISVGPAAEIFDETSSVEEALVTAIDRLALAEEQEIIEGPTATTINGQEAATATVAGRQAGESATIFYVTLIRHQERVALIAGITLAEESEGTITPDSPYRETLATIAESVRLRQPAGPIVEGPLNFGDTVEGTIPEDGEVAWTFDGVAGERVNLTVEPLDPRLDVTVDLLDSAGNSILPAGAVDEAFGIETVEGMVLPEDDEYRILLAGFAGSGGDYMLTVNLVTDTPAGEAVILSPNNNVAGVVGPDEADTYLLTEVIGQPVTVLVEPDPDFDVVVDLFGPDGGLVESSDGWFEGEIERLSFTPEGGNIQVRGYAGSAGDYTITLLEGSPEAAGSIVLISDTLLESDADIVYPFYAPARELVTAYVEPEEDLDLVIEAWEADEETLLETVDHAFGAEQINFTSPAEGNYFFAVYGFEGATGTYSLTLQGTAATIFELAPGDEVAGQLADGTILEYTVLLNGGEGVLFTATGEEETDVTLEIVDLDDNVLAAADETGGSETETLSFTAPGNEEELYLLRVGEFSGTAGSFTLLVE